MLPTISRFLQPKVVSAKFATKSVAIASIILVACCQQQQQNGSSSVDALQCYRFRGFEVLNPGVQIGSSTEAEIQNFWSVDIANILSQLFFELLHDDSEPSSSSHLLFNKEDFESKTWTTDFDDPYGVLRWTLRNKHNEKEKILEITKFPKWEQSKFPKFPKWNHQSKFSKLIPKFPKFWKLPNSRSDDQVELLDNVKNGVSWASCGEYMLLENGVCGEEGESDLLDLDGDEIIIQVVGDSSSASDDGQQRSLEIVKGLRYTKKMGWEIVQTGVWTCERVILQKLPDGFVHNQLEGLLRRMDASLPNEAPKILDTMKGM